MCLTSAVLLFLVTLKCYTMYDMRNLILKEKTRDLGQGLRFLAYMQLFHPWNHTYMVPHTAGSGSRTEYKAGMTPKHTNKQINKQGENT